MRCLSLDLERHEASVGAYEAALTPPELALVKILIETAGRPQDPLRTDDEAPRDEILTAS